MTFRLTLEKILLFMQKLNWKSMEKASSNPASSADESTIVNDPSELGEANGAPCP